MLLVLVLGSDFSYTLTQHAHAPRPCDEADELFANVVKRAQMEGVKVLAHDVAIDVASGSVHWGHSLPVRYSERVTGHVDLDRLQQVLEFNKTDPRKNWKKSSRSS